MESSAAVAGVLAEPVVRCSVQTDSRKKSEVSQVMQNAAALSSAAATEQSAKPSTEDPPKEIDRKEAEETIEFAPAADAPLDVADGTLAETIGNPGASAADDVAVEIRNGDQEVANRSQSHFNRHDVDGISLSHSPIGTHWQSPGLNVVDSDLDSTRTDDDNTKVDPNSKKTAEAKTRRFWNDDVTFWPFVILALILCPPFAIPAVVSAVKV